LDRRKTLSTNTSKQDLVITISFPVNFFRMPYKARIAPSGVATVSTVEGRTGRGVRPVKGRRGTLYHLSSILEEKQNGTTTLDDVRVRRRFATSRYFLSPAGVLKLVVIVSTVLRYLYRIFFLGFPIPLCVILLSLIYPDRHNSTPLFRIYYNTFRSSKRLSSGKIQSYRQKVLRRRSPHLH
jgi:hypothetical protein